MDAALYVKEQENSFDVIIVDSSDPVGKISWIRLSNGIGPAESLYTNSFYNTMKSALREGGIICTQVFIGSLLLWIGRVSVAPPTSDSQGDGECCHIVLISTVCIYYDSYISLRSDWFHHGHQGLR